MKLGKIKNMLNKYTEHWKYDIYFSSPVPYWAKFNKFELNWFEKKVLEIGFFFLMKGHVMLLNL
jgi:hypothetical protein